MSSIAQFNPSRYGLAGCFVALLTLLLSGTAFAAQRDPLAVTLPELEVMPGARWYWVGQHMAVNNVPMSIKMFSYSGSGGQVRDFYLGLWKVAGHGKLSRRSLGDMQVLGYELDGIQYSVQYAEHSNQVEGKLVVSPTPLNYSASKDTELRLPPRTKVSSKVETLESGRRSETLTLESSLGFSQVLDFYKIYLEGEGWTQYSYSENRNNGGVAGFQRMGELLQLNIKQLQGSNGRFSQILINWVK